MSSIHEFIAAMEKAGWKHEVIKEEFMIFYHTSGAVYIDDGTYIKNGRLTNVGDWREWLANDRTPPPF